MDSKEISEQFEQLYKSKIECRIAPLEENRKKLQKLYKIVISSIVLLFLVAIVVSVISQGGKTSLYVWGVFILTNIIAMFIICPKRNKYRKEVKNKLLMNIFSIFGKFFYSDKPVISLQEIKDNGLYNHASKKKDDDVIIGKYKDIEVFITETRLYHINSSDESTTEEETDFSGLILKIKMNKNFEGHTVVRQKPMSYEQFMNNIKIFQSKNNELIPAKILTLIENPLVKLAFKGMQYTTRQNILLNNKPGNLEDVKLEDTEFNNIFDIFSDNQVEARYLLTPSFMERLKMISMVMLVMEVHCIFKDGYITLFLGNPIMSDLEFDRGFFELEPNKSGQTLYDKEIYRRVFIELITIFDFIYHFKLDQKIGM